MITHFDHVTVAVRDLGSAKRFFTLLGFEERASVVIAGKTFANYMGLAEIEADHVTLVLKGASPRLEIQLLHYRRPSVAADPDGARLDRPGYNHICFAVDDIAAMIASLVAEGVELRSEVMEFHDRKLVFLRGPEGITVELSEWR